LKETERDSETTEKTASGQSGRFLVRLQKIDKRERSGDRVSIIKQQNQERERLRDQASIAYSGTRHVVISHQHAV
jgi:hypothetical protein